MKKTIVFLMGAISLWGCSGNGGSTEVSDMTLDGDLITVAEKSPVLQRIGMQNVAISPYCARFTTSGAVKAIPSAYGEIAVPFSGRIVKSFVRLGQHVAKGTPLFELNSSDYFETCRTYFDAAQELDQAEKALARAKDLQANHVGAAKDVEEAQMNRELKRQACENAKSALRIFDADPSGVRLGEPLTVRAPIAGKVVSDRIVIGQYVKEDTEPLAVIADLKKVWFAANVKEKDIPLLGRLQEVEIALAAAPDAPVRGRICHIGDLLDEQTRAVEVIIECDNADGRMKPNMYGVVRLTDTPVDAVKIPTSAILQQEESCYVLKAEGGNRFRKTPVSVIATEDDRAVIGSGLAVGDTIVVKGAYYLLEAK